MIITLPEEKVNRCYENFGEMVVAVREVLMSAGREIIRQILEDIDEKILKSRDKGRYRSKGLRKTSIMCEVGVVEYRRRVYVDTFSEAEEKHCVYLLDEALEIEKIGRIDAELCQKMAEMTCETSYRKSAGIISDIMGDSVHETTVWNVVQKMGERKKEETEQLAELAKRHEGKGKVQTKILYEEADGDWLKLQGKDRQEHGANKEMKIGIAYDGVWKKPCKGGTFRRILDNKAAFASFEAASEFRYHKEGIIANLYNMEQIELRVKNGDGASWIQTEKGYQCLCVLDAFHRNDKIKRCVKNPEIKQKIRELLYSEQIGELFSYLTSCISLCQDADEKERLSGLLSYYTENKDALTNYYHRNVLIPDTRIPGELHHARLGSMESNVFTLIGNRMKRRRACWSIQGGNHLAALLCAYHTDGSLWAVPLPTLPAAEPKPLSASKIKDSSGNGYEFPHIFHFPPKAAWLEIFSKLPF